MNICYINPTNNIRRPIAELANILTKEGHNITIMYPQSQACPTKNWIANETINNPKIRRIPIKSRYFTPLRYNLPTFFRLVKETKKIFKNNDYVHIWEYYYPLSVIVLLYASLRKNRRRRTILTTDGFVAYPYKPKEPWWLTPAFKIYTQLFARFLFKIPKFITIYGKPMVPYAKKVGVPLKKLRIIPTGIHPERFQKVDKRKVAALKKEFNLKKEKVILYVGMLTERKRVDKVIKVSQRLLEEGLNIKTLMVGDAHGKNVYKTMVKPEYKDKIIFTGGRKDIPELMHLADVLVLLSEEEGLPGVVMEAMASGLPVVATNVGCISELIEDGKEGFLVDDGNHFSKIKQILTDEKIQNLFRKNSLEKIKNFDWKTVSKQYISLYLL